jgi:hypothetical protein
MSWHYTVESDSRPTPGLLVFCGCDTPVAIRCHDRNQSSKANEGVCLGVVKGDGEMPLLAVYLIGTQSYTIADFCRHVGKCKILKWPWIGPMVAFLCMPTVMGMNAAIHIFWYRDCVSRSHDMKGPYTARGTCVGVIVERSSEYAGLLCEVLLLPTCTYRISIVAQLLPCVREATLAYRECRSEQAKRMYRRRQIVCLMALASSSRGCAKMPPQVKQSRRAVVYRSLIACRAKCLNCW